MYINTNKLRINQSQIKIIHIAKQQLGLTEDDYRNILVGFGVSSSKELSFADARKLINKLEKLGFEQKPTNRINKSSVAIYGYGKQKYESLRGRDAEIYPSPRTLRMVEAIWRDKSRGKSDEGLRKLLKKICDVDDITFLKNDNVQKIISALKNLGGK